MSKMKANFRKGNLGTRLIIVVLMLSMLIAAVGSTAALAWNAEFGILVAGSNKVQQDGSLTASLTETLNFQSDKVFVGTSDMNKVYSLVIKTSNIGTTTPLQLKISGDGGRNKWETVESGTEITCTYKSREALTKGTFDTLMSQLSISFNNSSQEKFGMGSVSIQAYRQGMVSSINLIRDRPYTTYTCHFSFYNYARGEAEKESAKMDYKSDYAASYDSSYASDVPDGQVNTGVLVESPDAAGGKAEFDLYLTEKGRGLKASVGYQIKKSTEAWTTSVTQKYVKEIDNLSKWDINEPIHISVEGLEAGKTYDVRGMIATDGKTSAPKYTSALSFCYKKPIINSLHLSGITTIYQGGKGLMNLSVRATFNDSNAVGVENYVGADGRTYSGPALKEDVYFTANRNFTTTEDKDGNEVYDEDHSVWYRIPSFSATKEMTDSNGTVSTTFVKDWLNFRIPSCLQDLGVAGNTEPINSTTCAFKVVVTDLYTGYTTVSYSDPFTIDSGAPTKPVMTATSGGVNKDLSLDQATVVGGTGEDGTAKVSIDIGGSTDNGGSGVKQYSYSMYYLPTDSVPGGLSDTADVLQRLSTYTPASYDAGCDYRSWAPLSDKLNSDGTPVDNMAVLEVSKDGYYRVIARAEDEAGFVSEEVEGYFRVDLTPPKAPQARLAKKEGGTFKPYDNRTYTESNVWAFAYSEPQTGKALKSFKFSTNGGLTWTDISTIAADKKMVNLTNTSATVPVYSGNNYTSSQNFVYQIGIDLTGLGFSDYVPVLFKAVDTLGNESMVSNQVDMRTSSTVTTVATLSHDPIEVAMALGNTELEMERNIVPLKVRAAKMINEKYYGTSGSSNINAANFNPYLYTMNHTCTYATDSGTGACTQGASCPYNIVENAGHSIYKPEWINISGLMSGDTSKKITEWVQYDHDTRTGVNVPISANGRVRAYSDQHAVGNGDNGEDTNQCMQRKRHIMDIGGSGDWSKILFAGVSVEANSDWLFYHFSQNTNKSIIFTMDTAKCDFHTYHQSGFWFNTTIRQNQAGTWVVSGYRVMIVQGGGSWTLTDKRGQTANCGVQVQKFTDQPVETLADSGGTNTGTVIATASLSGSGKTIQNFMIDLTGSSCTIYKIEDNMAASNMNVKYFRANGAKILSNVSTPRPTVDGHTIGNVDDASNPYRDTDCYGFGPAIGYSSHSCQIETRVEFSNIAIFYNVGRTLSEVVTEPSWGEGKARFIMNLSDDPQGDFSDPVLTAQIQWRLNNDKARYVGWGKATQRQGTIDFLNRMAGQGATDEERALYGMYESRLGSGAQGTSQEFTDLATYITQQYYIELGFNTANGIIKDQVSPSGGIAKGIAYTLDNISNLHLAVNPPERGLSSANPDFPAGRWYMVHDAKGMGEEVDPRSGKHSDALETGITLPGRYTFYFAPPEEDVKNNTLDPDTAIFDFVVNQKPQAQFTASIVNQGSTKVLQINDLSYDPDCPNGPVSEDGVQLSGIIKREWKYQFLMKQGDDLVVARESAWGTTSLNGRSLNSLTGYNTLPSNSVLTVYERVTDTATRRVAVKDASGKVTGYRYVAINGAVSDVCQANATEGVSITYAPQSVMVMTPTIMYDTASDSSSAHRVVTIERVSSHPQGNNFIPSWAINLTEMNVTGADPDTGYTQLSKSGNNYYYGSDLALKCVQAPTSTGNIGNGETGSVGGKWEVSYDFIKKYAAIGKHIKLQLTEKTWGISAATAAAGKTEKSYIPDQSARSILYSKDTNAPTSQVVTTGMQISGSSDLLEYAANSYLDVTNNDKFVVINAGGSEDKEGALRGYGYYFYEKNSSGTETKWYKMNADGTLTQVSNATQAMQRLPATGGTIRIGKSAMRKTPTDSLNVAIFAYDNQTGMATETGGNQTSKTRITDIKLSISKPMPPEISVTNMMNQNVAYISNENGSQANIAAGKTDVQTTDLFGFSSTNVTVRFDPRRAKYITNSSGDLVLNAGGQEYYQDYYGAADMTGVANVQYSLKYKAREAQEWWTDEQMLAAGMNKLPVNVVIPSAQTLTLSDDGVYEVTASIVNGSGTVSDTRTVRFTIDKTAPAGLDVQFLNEDGSEYVSNVWTKTVRIVASGATDTNAETAEYQYSSDGGKTWTTLGGLTQASAEIEFTKSGKYTVLVRAIDKAGNEAVYPRTMLVCIDTTPPETKGPTLTATSVMKNVLDEYVISLSFDETTGKIISNQGDGANELDREVAVPAGGTVFFEFHPSEGHILGTVTYMGQDVTEQVQHDEDNDIDYLVLENVTEDATLSATFPKTELEAPVYRSLTRSMAAVQFAMARTVSREESDEGTLSLAASEEGSEGDSGETTEPVEPDLDPSIMYNVEAHELDSHGFISLSQNQVAPGGKVLVTLRPNVGYRVASLQINSEFIDVSTLAKVEHSNVRTYELIVNQDNTMVYAGFERIPTRTLRLTTSDCGSVTIFDSEENVLNHGDGEYQVPEGEEIYIQMDSENGYSTKSLLIDGVQPDGFLPGAAVYEYNVPAYTGEGEDPGIDVKVEFDVLSTARRVYKVSVGVSSEDGQPHGTIATAGEMVNIPVGGARTFVITPEPGYKVAHLYLSHMVDGDMDTEDVAGSTDLKLQPGDIRQYKYTLKDPGSNGALEVIFERQTYSISSMPSTGGDIGFKAADGGNLAITAVPEGKDVLILPLPKTGYRVKSLTIFEMEGSTATKGYSVGAVSSYVLKSIHSNIRVEAEFVERTVDHIETTHVITAVANNVKDADDALAAEPYRFRIADAPEGTPGRHVSAWSAWSESNTITYTGSFLAETGEEITLEPNKQYFVSLRTRDRVGNISDEKISTVYSMANMPGTLGAEALDDEGNYATKSVALTVDTSGNPEGTEYMVYVSNSSSMTDMFIANENEPGGGWATLGDGDKFIIRGLAPGRWYHLQVVARNHDGHSTSLNSKDITSIMLSPAAPPADSFYFEEQASPNSPIVLSWEVPTGEVKGVQIYRDGMFLVELDAEILSYEDARVNFAADAISKYSYAYVNAAGVGSSRVAVSGEYYKSKYSSSTDPAKAAKMDQLVRLTEYEYLFSETMTYPCFPYGCKEPVSASTPGGTENSGRITVQMKYDPNESGRYQKYFLTLKAFEKEVNVDGEPVLDGEGNPIYHEVDITKWDPTKANREADGVTQKAKETKVTQVSGETAARATWTNLSTAYEYKIYVKEIRSNGATTSENLGGQTQGVEYSLGKQFVVNRNGYYFEYTKDTSTPYLNTASGTWTDAELAAYTRYEEEGWDTPVNKGYITFNKSPSVELAKEEDRYYDNDASKVQTAGDGKSYLLVDQSMMDKTFHVNVAAWDPDGSRAESALKPAVNGTIATVPGAAPEITTEMPKSQEAANQRENLYPVTFDASGLPTGVYTSMEMRASDSDTETKKTTDDIRLVVNRNTPQSSVIGGTSRQLENRASYKKGDLVQIKAAAARDNAASTNLSKVALLVMPAEYQAALGSNDYDTLYQQLCVTGDATVVAKAKALLGADASSSKFVVGGKLTEAGMNLAIARVTPPITKYVTITEEQYNARLATAGDKLLKDVGSKITYWAELEYALSENICSWLKSSGSDTVTPDVELKATDRENTYMMKLVARFGGNTSSQTVDFVIKSEPFTQIRTKKSFIWRDTSKAEYDYYVKEGYTVADIINKYDECYDHDNIIFEDPLPDSQNAYTTKVENGKTVYMVYKLVDSEGNVGNDYISGEVRTSLGVHPQFDEVGVLLVTDRSYNPNTGAEFPIGYIDSPVYVNYNHTPVTVGGDLKFGVSGLSEGVTYYLWSYYKLPDQARVYNKDHVAMTTEDSFQMAQYGFTRSKYSYKEADYPEGRSLAFNINKLGSADASATVRVTPRYYQADEFGNLILEGGNPVELTGEALSAARETFGFAGGREYDTITFGDSSSKDAILRLQDTDKMQGHMVVRLMLTIESSDAGYCYVANGGAYTDVFIQDDESPVTSYILGVINKDENGKPFMTEVKNTSTGMIDRYEYQFSGLQVNYSQLSNLLLSYENAGTGDLENITAVVYDDREGLTPSSYFEAERPSETNLKQSLGGIGTVEIHPISGLEDGVYEGWVFLSADHVEDPVKIKIRQVVGQSTLKGRIYITPEMPLLTERTGVAKISLYDAEKATLQEDGSFNVPPVYTTESKEYGGEFEIQNILNKGPYSGGKYYIVVERDGFLTYNGRKYRPRPTAYSLELGTASKTYTFDLRLIGGDVNGDQKVNDTDLNILIEHYNRYTGLEGTSPEEEAITRRCDFNQDGVVNALDRGFLIGNLGSTDESYPYRSFSPIQPDDE